MEQPPAFAADAMLGSLARWLRLLGYDCLYEADIADEKLVALAKAEGRIVLTRDRAVAQKAGRAIFVAGDDLDDQLLAVAHELHLQIPDEPPTTRCSMCNVLLVPAREEDLERGAVPERVRALHRQFWACPSCKRVYWKGTHFDSMGERLRSLKARLETARPDAAEGA